MLYSADRWNTATRWTFGWVLGTNWQALAPVSITAMCSPVRPWSWFVVFAEHT
jgi:hypothetical protein